MDPRPVMNAMTCAAGLNYIRTYIYTYMHTYTRTHIHM